MGTIDEDKSQVCPYCCNLNYDMLISEFITAFGERYYALLNTILSIKGKAIYDRAREVHKTKGKLTPHDVCHLLMEFKFPPNRMKPFFEWLEQNKVCYWGTYKELQHNGFMVTVELAKLGYIEATEELITPTSENIQRYIDLFGAEAFDDYWFSQHHAWLNDETLPAKRKEEIEKWLDETNGYLSPSGRFTLEYLS